MKTLNPLAEYPFVLEDDRGLPKEQRTTWYLRHREARSYWKTQDMITEGVEVGRGGAGARMSLHSGSMEFEILKDGLVRVENLRHPDPEKDEELQVPSQRASDDKWYKFFAYIPHKYLKELANAITEGDFLEEDESKNSES